MKIDIRDTDGQITAMLKGRLDTKASMDYASSFIKLGEQASRQITLDCSQLDYISSSGLRHFLMLAKKTHTAGGHLTVTHPQDDIKEVFKVTGFYKLLDIQE